MKLGILTLALIAISTGAVAKDSPVIDQREYLDSNGQPTLERKVLLENTKGEDVVVTQILHPLDDGSLKYIPTQQLLETQAFDAELCGRPQRHRRLKQKIHGDPEQSTLLLAITLG